MMPEHNIAHLRLKLTLTKKSLGLTRKALTLALMEFKRISYQKKAAPEVLEAIERAVEHIDWCLIQIDE